MDNQSVRAGSLRQSQPVGYSIVFSPDKPQASVPKCVQNYRSKPAASPGSLQKKLEEAAERRKVSCACTKIIRSLDFIIACRKTSRRG